MKFKMDDHLPPINDIQYDGNRKLFHNILLDTGSSSTIQLGNVGNVREMHGFDAIIGTDFFVSNKLIIDFNNFEARKA